MLDDYRESLSRILEHLEVDAFVDSTKGSRRKTFLDDTRRDRRSDLSKEVRETEEGGEGEGRDGLMMRGGDGDYTKVSLKEQ